LTIPTTADLAQAALVLAAANMGGFLIDSSGLLPGMDPAKRQALDELATAGFAERVAEAGQVPYYRLVHRAAD
jgi:hypothetical protein